MSLNVERLNVPLGGPERGAFTPTLRKRQSAPHDLKGLIHSSSYDDTHMLRTDRQSEPPEGRTNKNLRSNLLSPENPTFADFAAKSPRSKRRSLMLTLSPKIVRRLSKKMSASNLTLLPLEPWTTSGTIVGEIAEDLLLAEQEDFEFEVQRIPEYDKYLSDLLSETQENHPDYDDLRKAAGKVKDMVKDREGEANAVDNDYKVERVQDLFPNDDLQLREKDSKMKSKLIQRRRSAPSAVLLKSLGSARTKVAAVSGNGDSNSLPRLNNSVNRLYLMEGSVQLSLGLQKLDRYLFLFNDILLIAKQKSNTTFKLKHRIRVCEMWINEQCLDDVSDVSKTNEKSFVIGWPTTNMVASFSTPELKEQWLTKLKNQIGEEKTKEEPETVQLKVMMSRDTEEVVKTKSFPVEKSTEVLECVQRCMEEFEIQDGDAKDFQLWVVSGKEDSPYPLIGHEHPYSIKMSHIRDQSRMDSDGSVLPVQDMDTSPDKVSDRNYQCQFVLKHGKKPLKKFSLDETGSTKKKKVPTATLR